VGLSGPEPDVQSAHALLLGHLEPLLLEGLPDQDRGGSWSEPGNDSGLGKEEKFAVVFQDAPDLAGDRSRIRTVKGAERNALGKGVGLERKQEA
jgi:hypothetical protein